MALTLVCGFWAILPVLAFGPEDALNLPPAAYDLILDRVDLAAFQEGAAGLGAYGWVQTDYVTDWQYRAGLGISLDPVRRLQAELNSEKARAQARARERAAVYEALALHARAWQARADEEAARVGVVLAEMALQSAKARGYGSLQIEDAELALEEARLALEEAENRLRSCLEEARLLGLEGQPEPQTLVFATPPARADRQSQIEYRLQLARRDRSLRGLFAVRAAATYTSGERDYRFELRSAEPRFDFSLGPKFPFSQTGDWRYTFSLRLALDPAAWAQAGQARLAAEETRRRGEREGARRRTRLDFWSGQVGLALKRLDLARERLQLAERLMHQAERRHAAGLISDVEKRRAELQWRQAESRLAAAWAAYLRAVDGYLEAADREWRVE